MVKPNDNKAQNEIDDIRDVSQFCLEWNTLRNLLLTSDIDGCDLEPSQKKMLFWMKEVVDSVCLPPKSSDAEDQF